MDFFLQLWGGLCYLLNKIFFSISETQNVNTERKLKIIGWVLYIIGVPAWVIILVGHNDWIAASIEAGGIPAMILGLYNTIHDHKKTHKAFNAVVTFCTYASLVFGLSVSLYIHGGIVSISQILEIGVMLGFLLGSYFLAKGNSNGWLFFMLMNISMAALMYIQGKPVLMGQQLLSLCFVFYGYTKAKQNIKVKMNKLES